MTPEEAERIGRSLVGLIDALGEHGDVGLINRMWNGRWYATADSERLGRPYWPRIRVHSRTCTSLADALDDLAARIRKRESRRRIG